MAAAHVDAHTRAWRATGWVVALLVPAAAFANAAAYIAYAGNPLVSSDAWYFINAFLRNALEQGPTFQDFFVKRDALDHAQPVLKLLLLANARWLGLDFVFEALVGLAFAAGTFLLIVATTRPVRQEQPWWLWALSIGALAAVMVTLNSGMVYSWSLVTLVFIPYFMTVVGACLAWRTIATGRYVALFLVSLVIAFSFDDVGLIIAVALITTTLLGAARSGRLRVGIIASLVIAAAEACYLAASPALIDIPAPAAVRGTGVTANLELLWGMRGEWGTMARIAFGSTLAHINPLLEYAPDSAVEWQGALAVLALLGHAWFWWRAVRGGWNHAVFYAVTIMLVFYAMVAGILYGRVPTYGASYLHEPRYVAIYLLSSVALVLMLMGQRPSKASRGYLRAAAGLALVALLALQVPLARFTWDEGRYLSVYYHTMARQMLQLGAGVEPASCVPLLTVCSMPPPERAKAIGFLKRNELNVYSEAFRERYQLQKLVAP